jgi:hypothetical protein
VTEVDPVNRDAVATTLNEHGYPFHYAVLRQAQNSYDPGSGSPWILEATEFPVAVGTHDTRIDFILKHAKYSRYLIAECKRVNPKYSQWCFFRAPYIHRERDFEMVSAEVWESADGRARSSGALLLPLNKAYHIALPIRLPENRGDSGGSGFRAIEEAATQVSRQINGFTEQLIRTPSVLGGETRAILFSVLFTTAKLFVTDVDIGAAVIETGAVDADAMLVGEAPWVPYQYHVSVSSRSAITQQKKPPTLGHLLDQEFVRTIFVVNAAHITAFLTYLGHIG